MAPAHSQPEKLPLIAQIHLDAGNELHTTRRGFLCGHGSVHSSKKGKCVHIDTEKQVFFCHHCQTGGGIIQAVMSLYELSYEAALQHLKDHYDWTPPHNDQEQQNPWPLAKPAPDWLAQADPEFRGLAKDILAPGAITLVAAPRGLGKTQVSHALAVALACGTSFRGEAMEAEKVLLIDRDNPDAVIKRRLRSWGAAEAANLHVLTRQDAPDLKNKAAWDSFPRNDYDVVIIDSVGSATEGITEKEGKQTTEVLATILNLARHGIAVLLLQNVTKDGANLKGRGEWTDRADIVYEVRDATSFQPSGQKPWWQELPASGESAWAERAARRKGRTDFRLAFVPSKFRIGLEPEPFCLELSLPPDAPWSLQDVTDEIIETGQESIMQAKQERTEKLDQAAYALLDIVKDRAAVEDPILKKEAETFLHTEEHLSTAVARNLVNEREDELWRIKPIPGRKGHPKALLPVLKTTPQPKSEGDENLGNTRVSGDGISVAPMESAHRNTLSRKPLPVVPCMHPLFRWPMDKGLPKYASLQATTGAGSIDTAISVNGRKEKPAEEADPSLEEPEKRSNVMNPSDLNRSPTRSSGHADPSIEAFPAFETPPYHLITTPAELETELARLRTEPVLGIDTETTGLDPFNDRLRLIQIAGPERTLVVDLNVCSLQALTPLFTQEHELVFHNASFDLQFLTAAGLPWPKKIFDTMLIAQLLGAGTADGYLNHCALQDVVQRILGVALPKDEQVSDWSGPLRKEQLDYAAKDAAVLLPLQTQLNEYLTNADLHRAAAIENRCVPALAWLELTGLPIDDERWGARAKQDEERVQTLEDRLHELVGLDVIPRVNWKSPKQVLEIFQAHGHDIKNTNSETLVQVEDPLAPLVLDYREAGVRARTFGTQWLEKHQHPITKRIHAHYHQLGAASGRMSCAHPNVQNIPRNPAYRSCIRPEEGRAVVKADLSQIELRIAAVIAQDTAMLAAFEDQQDLHALTAANVLGISMGAVEPEQRQLAKALNFGLLYGMGGTRA